MTDFWLTFQNTFNTSDLTTQLPEQAAVIPLSQLSLIEISGEDASGFLQNLLTNDVEQLASNQAQLTGICNPKGRVIALFWLIKKQNDQFFALLPCDAAGILQKRLSMFVLRSKVTIKAISDTHAAFALTQPSGKLETITLAVNLNVEFVVMEQQQAIETIKNLTAQQYQLCAPSVWELITIHAGIPSVYEASTEAFTPQQINLDIVGGVSFQKGCYPGQEVVARLHYLGSPSRRLFLVEYQGEQLTVNGLVTDTENNTVGHVVSSTVENMGQALVSLKLSEIDKELQVNSKALKIVKALAVND